MDLRERNPLNPHRHPWELARAASILALLPPLAPEACLADVGEGDLYIAHLLAARMRGPLFAVDAGYADLSSQENIRLLRDVSQLPDGAVDCMLVLDMIEHVDDDLPFVQSLLRPLKPGAAVIFTVPAHPVLFSPHDVFLRHRRRYRRARLAELLRVAGFHVDELFHFYGTLLAVRCLQLAFVKVGLLTVMEDGVGNWRHPESHAATRCGRAVLAADFAVNRFLQRRLGFSAGLSLCAICRKPRG